MRLIDERYTACPFYGSRRMTVWLTEQGEEVNRKRVRRLMRVMGLEAIYPKPRLSLAGKGHRIYPYLLRGVKVVRPDQVWSTDITYVPMTSGFMYLAAVIDWFSRYVIAWRLSNTLAPTGNQLAPPPRREETSCSDLFRLVCSFLFVSNQKNS